jgi:Rrf2 family protein
MSVISTRSRYGLRFLVDLAEAGGGEARDLHSVAESQGIPEAYLSKLTAPLIAAGFIRSLRGARGGYVLAAAPEDIDLYSVVEVLEGYSSLVECTTSPSACPRSANCGARDIWAGLEEVMRNYLKGKTLAGVVGARSSPEYYI